ncbi:hypothetical protein [Prochlorococcus sp. MIT 1307]|uniref:hypothetical protein n=1 Tax=Prochlorococcus sp. MIT 1307 TaxID=3096219 RepID=UPI002A75CFFB|nr:hypothetical protein [Prochlorococcus sp. MIT 1307]
MKNKNIVYLYEVEELLGGEGLSPYDLATITSNEVKWSKQIDENDSAKEAA